MKMRCPRDGRFMRRLGRDSRWWMCSGGCMELRCSDRNIQFGWALMQSVTL